MKHHPTVGMPILYFQSGIPTPLAGTIASVDSDGRVNISYLDAMGATRAHQGVPFTDTPSAGGDYVVFADDVDKATEAHQAAMRAGFHGQPHKRADGAKTTAPAGDFTSAALAGDNVQAAGSGGPFDPANTAKAHMTQHQTEESQSVGHPTTGGMTPKLSADNLHTLSERDREAAAAILKAKGTDEQARLATSNATRGTAAAIANPPKATVAAPPPAASFGFANQEQTRIEREAKQHDEAVRRSAEITRERGGNVATSAAKKVPSKKAVKKSPTKSKR